MMLGKAYEQGYHSCGHSVFVSPHIMGKINKKQNVSLLMMLGKAYEQGHHSCGHSVFVNPHIIGKINKKQNVSLLMMLGKAYEQGHHHNQVVLSWCLTWALILVMPLPLFFTYT